MAKIIDPDDLVMSTTLGQVGTDGNIFVDTSTKLITLADYVALGNATYADGGVSLQAIYSFLKEEWKVDTQGLDLIKYAFPMVAITPEQFEFVETWKPVNANTITYFRDAGFAVMDGAVSAEEYIGVITLGDVNGAQVYHAQEAGNSVTTDFNLTEAVNECVKVFGDGSNGDFDYRSYFTVYAREYQYVYDQANHTDIGVATFTYQAYRFPLSNGGDLKITDADAIVATGTTYTNIDIEYLVGQRFEAYANTTAYVANDVVQDVGDSEANGYDAWYITTTGGTSDGATMAASTVPADWALYSGQREIQTGVYWPYNIIVDGDLADNVNEDVHPTTAQIYTKIQYDLRQAVDIDAGAGLVTGQTASLLLGFVGDTLVTESGVFVDDFRTADKNTIEFYDYNGNKRVYDFVSVGSIAWNDNLSGDTEGIYNMFFTDANGNLFGTAGAILVEDNDAAVITGTTSGANTAGFTFNYDNNAQGGRTPATDADITVVAIGYNKAQYVKSTATIERTATNSVSLVAALERNYSNPA